MTTLTVFSGDRRLASGSAHDAGAAARAALRLGETVTVFDDATGRVVDLDPQGVPAVSGPAHAEDRPRGRGRPRMGVVAKEITLLPRHWEWLSRQKGGASATLRRLVDAARRETEGKADRDAARERAYRVMTVLAGDRAGYEDALRALFAGDRTAFADRIASWPDDVRTYVAALAQEGFQ